jgi:UDP-N-acetylmuramoylalanine--D-glutamate ligase
MDRQEQKLAGRRWLVVGAGRSGRGAARLLRAAGYESRWVDEMTAPTDGLADETRTGTWRPDWLDGVDGVVWSPGIPLSHPIAHTATQAGLPVIAEVELAWRFASAPVVAITGSNGKTTTTRWTAEMLRASGRRAVASGNIGSAFSEVVADELEGGETAEVHVVENSSFQLESIDRYRPEVAAILNVTPDHLDRYGDMATYVAAKERVALNMTPGQTLIVNGEDAACAAIASRARCDVVCFGRDEGVPRGAAIDDDDRLIWRHRSGQSAPWVAIAQLGVPGMHNALNALAAGACARLMGATDTAIRSAMRDFRGVEHRIEFVAEIDGVRYYNDSKSTNVQSLKVALNSFEQPVVLIAGGRDKGGAFGEIRDLVRGRAVHAILIGEAAGTIAEQWLDTVALSMAADMASAVARARELAAPGQTVLLSPACASFDQYANFEERGCDFKNIVRGLE